MSNMDNMDQILETDMDDPIEPAIVESILSTEPFHKLNGSFNVRDMSDPAYPALKRGYAFRFGSLEGLTPQGQTDLINLGVKKVFDLRSPAEISAHPTPITEGVDVVTASTEANQWIKPAYENETNDLAEMYLHMLQTYKIGIQAIVAHIRDFPDRPFLLHCTGEINIENPVLGMS